MDDTELRLQREIPAWQGSGHGEEDMWLWQPPQTCPPIKISLSLSPLVFPQSSRGLLGRCNYQLLNQSHQQQPNLKVNYPIIGLGLGCGGTQAGGEGRVPAQPLPVPSPPILLDLLFQPAQLCSLRGLWVLLGSPHPKHHPVSPQGAQRRSGNGFWLAPTEEFCFQGAMDGICCLLSPLRAVDPSTLGEGRGCWVGGEGAGLSPGTPLAAHSFPQQTSLWDTGGKTQQLEQIPSTASQARFGGITLVPQFPWMRFSPAIPWVRWGQG